MNNDFNTHTSNIRSLLMGDELGVSTELSDTSLAVLKSYNYPKIWYHEISNNEAQVDLWTSILKIIYGDHEKIAFRVSYHNRIKFIPFEFKNDSREKSQRTLLRIDYLTNKIHLPQKKEIFESILFKLPADGFSVYQQSSTSPRPGLHRIYYKDLSNINIHRGRIKSLMDIPAIINWAVSRDLISSTKIISSIQSSINTIRSFRIGATPHEISLEQSFNSEADSFIKNLENTLLLTTNNLSRTNKSSKISI